MSQVLPSGTKGKRSPHCPLIWGRVEHPRPPPGHPGPPPDSIQKRVISSVGIKWGWSSSLRTSPILSVCLFIVRMGQSTVDTTRVVGWPGSQDTHAYRWRSGYVGRNGWAGFWYRAEVRVNNLLLFCRWTRVHKSDWFTLTQIWSFQLGAFLEPFSSVPWREIILERDRIISLTFSWIIGHS